MNDLDNKLYSYSIAIRTLGTAGEKYTKLLNSIRRLPFKPEQVIVVLPEGYDPPQERLGNEQFVFCEKSMVQQRIEALKYIESEYTLFLDDDIEFEPDFVEKLLNVLRLGVYDCATGPLFSFFPHTLGGKVAGTIIGNVAFRIHNKGYYVRILRNGGWSYRYVNTKKNKCYPTESFAWTCFMIRTEAMQKVRMEHEKKWIEKNRYAWGDDRVMAYKLTIEGYKACIVSDALYTHNDAKTSTKGTVDFTKRAYCSSFFTRVFWQRFIQDREKNHLIRLLNQCIFQHTCWMECLYHAIKRLFSYKNETEKYRAYIHGRQDAERFIHSKEYEQLPPV